MEKIKKIGALIFIVGTLTLLGVGIGLVTSAQTNSVTATVTVSYYSVALSQESFNYGSVAAGTATNTLTLWGGIGIAATNTGSAADLDIQGNDTTGSGSGWTLNTDNTLNNYVHKFCDDTTNDCATPVTNYVDLGDGSYAELKANVANNAAIYFQLYLQTPVAPTDVSTQSSVVTVQASAPN